MEVGTVLISRDTKNLASQYFIYPLSVVTYCFVLLRYLAFQECIEKHRCNTKQVKVDFHN